jgi:broad specificity phosphatase PhoE
LSNLYLVRHGQAGTRDAYDALSELGRSQSRLLGVHLSSQETFFSAAYSGSLARQQETAANVRSAFMDKGLPFPEITVEHGWNEFNLDQIYREMAPLLCVDDQDFRREYEKMRDEIRSKHRDPAAEIHRRWHPCDTAMINAWITGRYPYTGESWSAFRKRVAACRQESSNGAHANVIVFSSAVPIAIWTGLALGIEDERILRLAGVLENTAFTVFKMRQKDLRLFTFNAVPHLLAPGLRTHR